MYHGEKTPQAQKRVLVVDDDPAIGRVVARMLKESYEVSVVTAGRDAIAALTADAGCYDAVLCDLMMPEVTGMDVYDALMQVDPIAAGRIVFFTGGAFTRRAVEFLRRVQNVRLEKPFDRAALIGVVEQALRTTG